MGKKAGRKNGANALICGILIAAGLYVLYFACLGGYPLLDPDEPVYGQVAREMAAGAGWITPHYGGRPWFDKPPLFYWLTGSSASLLGPTELACRLPSAVLAVALVLLVYALASHDFGKRAGILAAVVMATCIQQIVLARAAVTDMTLAVCLTAALYAYRRHLDTEGRARLGWAALCGAMAGLGMLAKGPVAAVLLSAAFFVHLWWTGRLRRLVSLEALAGVVTFLILGVPWYVGMYVLHRDAFVQGFLMMNNITRFLEPEHASQTGGWYSYFLNLPVLLAFFFPWSVFLPQAVSRVWRANDGARLAAVWFAVVFVFFSISKTQLPTYIFPLYPAAAVFVGVLWSSAASMDSREERRLRTALWTGLVISVLLAAVAIISAAQRFPEAAPSVIVLTAILILTVVAALAQTLRRRAGGASVAVWTMGAGMAVFTLWLMIGVMPVIAPRASARDLLRDLPDLSRVKLFEYSIEKPSIFFYAHVRPERTYDLAAVRRWMSTDHPVVVFCKETEAERIVVPGAVEWAKSGGLVVHANAAAASLKGSVAR